MSKGLERKIEHYSHGDAYNEDGVNTQNSFNTPPIPKTYDEYMRSNIVSKEWEAGFIAGKMHEVKRALAMVDMAMSVQKDLKGGTEV